MAVLTGRTAEGLVAEQLEGLGYKILARNWRTPACEIDIIARDRRTIYFIEVKYRQSAGQGTGLAYILPRKLEQMEFAARLWCQQRQWDGDWRLVAAEVNKQHNIDLVEIF